MWHFQRLALLSALGIFCLWLSPAIAQRPQSERPNATDLHAAYCTEILQTTIADSQSLVASFSRPEYSTVPGPNDPPYLLESKAKSEASRREAFAEIESEKATLRRIDLYLKPRVFNLDPLPLVAAKRAAQEDMARIDSAVKSCSNECPFLPDSHPDDSTKCTNACALKAMPDLPEIQKKTMSCSKVEWLPF
jgi:hypothetical protein